MSVVDAISMYWWHILFWNEGGRCELLVNVNCICSESSFALCGCLICLVHQEYSIFTAFWCICLENCNLFLNFLIFSAFYTFLLLCRLCSVFCRWKQYIKVKNGFRCVFSAKVVISNCIGSVCVAICMIGQFIVLWDMVNCSFCYSWLALLRPGFWLSCHQVWIKAGFGLIIVIVQKLAVLWLGSGCPSVSLGSAVGWFWF